MYIAVAIMTVLTVAVAAFVLVPRLGAGRIVYDRVPDRPVAFGYKMSWIAVRASEPRAVAEALGLDALEPANWRTGIGTVYDDELGESRIYVSPSVDGWIFVAGLALPPPVGPRFVDKCQPLLGGLSERFGEAQYYLSYPLIDFYGWVRASGGRVVRAFAMGDEGLIWNQGRTTREERALGLKLFEMRGVARRQGDAGAELILYPTEDHVMQLARSWSLDPTTLAEHTSQPGLGLIGMVPATWRAERARKAA